MNDEQRIAEIAARLAKATPGEWKVLEIPEQPDQFFVAAVPTPDHPYYQRTRYMDVIGDENYPRKRDDAELIAHAPSDIAYLLERVNALRKYVRHLPGCKYQPQTHGSWSGLPQKQHKCTCGLLPAPPEAEDGK